MKNIVRAPQGAGRTVVPINEVCIPDLWHIAMWLKDNPPPRMHDHLQGMPVHEAILETWHLTHDLLLNCATNGKC